MQESKTHVVVERLAVVVLLFSTIAMFWRVFFSQVTPEKYCLEYCLPNPFTRPEATEYDGGFECSCYDDPH